MENKPISIREFTIDSYLKMLAVESFRTKHNAMNYTQAQKALSSHFIRMLGKSKNDIVLEITSENDSGDLDIIMEAAKMFYVTKEVDKIVYVGDEDITHYYDAWYGKDDVILYKNLKNHSKAENPCFVIVDNIKDLYIGLELFDIYGNNSVYIFRKTTESIIPEHYKIK